MVHAGRRIQVVALLGSSASGKSTAAQHLATQHGFTRVRIAQPLKDMLRTLGLTEVQVDGPQKDREVPCDLLCGKSPRYAMQTLGTEWRDFIGKKLWVNAVSKRMEDMAAGKRIVRYVVDDMRFVHEVGVLRDKFDLTIVSIRRPEVEPTKAQRVMSYVPMPRWFRDVLHLLLGLKPLHRSEVEWFSIQPDAEIVNNKSLSDLWSELDDIVERTHV